MSILFQHYTQLLRSTTIITHRAKNKVSNGQNCINSRICKTRSLGHQSCSLDAFVVPRVHKAFDEDGRLNDEAYDKRVSKFLAEFEWYIEGLKEPKNKRDALLVRYGLIELSYSAIAGCCPR